MYKIIIVRYIMVSNSHNTFFKKFIVWSCIQKFYCSCTLIVCKGHGRLNDNYFILFGFNKSSEKI